MAGSLRHRGPDDVGIELVGSVGLVNARLAIVDPGPAGHAPMADPTGGWWLTYNGEIFNHLDLREQLGRRGYRGHGDTETLVNALAEWEDDTPRRCNGFFAYAALDVRGRRLLLVRDRFGVKPLYWARHDGALWFASEIAALRAAGVRSEVDRGALAYALLYGWVNGRPTMVQGVQRVLPGTCMEVSLDTLEDSERRWYDAGEEVDPERAASLRGRPRTEVVEAVREGLRASVERRMMSDVGLGTLCSGGLDSSLVTALARDVRPGIVAYNVSIPDQPGSDESEYAQRVAGALGVELRTFELTAARWREDLVSVVAHNEYPLTHPNSVPMMQIARLARADGIKVLLSGEGADELFGGYGQLHLELHLDYALRNRRLRAAASLMAGKLRRDGTLATARRALALARGWVGADSNGGDNHAQLTAEQFPGLVPSTFAASYDVECAQRASGAYGHQADETRRRLEAELLRELDAYLPHILNRLDKCTMQSSVETREPYLDSELVALALNLPIDVRMDPQRKAVLREVARRHIPDEIIRRPKYGFGFDVRRYLEGSVRPEFLLDGVLRDLMEAPREDWASALETNENLTQVLALWTGEIWARLVLEGKQVAEVERELWL